MRDTRRRGHVSCLFNTLFSCLLFSSPLCLRFTGCGASIRLQTKEERAALVFPPLPPALHCCCSLLPCYETSKHAAFLSLSHLFIYLFNFIIY